MKKLILIILLFGCTTEKSDDDLSAILAIAYYNRGNVDSFTSKVKQASKDWNFDYEVSLSDKKNLITNTLGNCEEPSISAKYKTVCKAGIPIKPLGLCIPERKNGKISASILIIFSNHYDYLDEQAKQATISHEIGHCLGLVHSDLSSDLMYYTLTDVRMPSEREKSALHDLYFTNAVSPLYFPNREKQDLPVKFTVDVNIGNYTAETGSGVLALPVGE